MTSIPLVLSGLMSSSDTNVELNQTLVSASTPYSGTGESATDNLVAQKVIAAVEVTPTPCPAEINCDATPIAKVAIGDNEAMPQIKVDEKNVGPIPSTFATDVQNKDPNAYFNSISCASDGECVGVGAFENSTGGSEAFTQTQTNGKWGIATPANFGLGVQNDIPEAFFESVSCPAPGNCVAAGTFEDFAGGNEAFTQTQTNGMWETAMPATFGVDVQSIDPFAYFNSISCPAPGNCVAAGTFEDFAGGNEAFTQTQTNGMWETAMPATFGVDVQSIDPFAYFNSISCPAPGNCVAAGSFRNFAGGYEAFTQTKTNGMWETAVSTAFGNDVQSIDPFAYFNSISCAAPGNCVAVGSFRNFAGGYEAFTQTQTDSIWDIATPAKFSPDSQNAVPDAYFESVSCPAVGNCVTVGSFRNFAGGYEAFTQTQTDSIWDIATPAKFSPDSQNAVPDAYFESVSCPAVGNCVTVGRFANSAGAYEAVIQTQRNGIWDTATFATFDIDLQNSDPFAYFNSISCLSTGECVAAGGFENATGGFEAFTQTFQIRN